MHGSEKKNTIRNVDTVCVFKIFRPRQKVYFGDNDGSTSSFFGYCSKFLISKGVRKFVVASSHSANNERDKCDLAVFKDSFSFKKKQLFVFQGTIANSAKKKEK